MPNVESEVANARRDLVDAWARYTTLISSEEMAVSLELASVLDALCRLASPQSVLDLGSGFSSYVVRRFARERGGAVTSVDTSPEWLERTGEFLAEEGLSTARLAVWSDFVNENTDTFDLVLHDMGRKSQRSETFPQYSILSSPEATFFSTICTSLISRRITEQRLLRETLLTHLRRLTLDRFGRYAALARPSRNG